MDYEYIGVKPKSTKKYAYVPGCMWDCLRISGMTALLLTILSRRLPTWVLLALASWRDHSARHRVLELEDITDILTGNFCVYSMS
jgi:hypothetical protein